MLRKINIRLTLTSAIIGAILFCIPVYVYIHRAHYEQTWLLYMGSFLFMIAMWISTTIDSRQRENEESTVAMVFASTVTTVAGIVISCFLCLLLLLLFVPGYLEAGNTDKILVNTPANTIQDKTNGLSFNIFMAATVINFSAGGFTALVLPFYIKRNQTRDQRAPTPMHQQGRK